MKTNLSSLALGLALSFSLTVASYADYHTTFQTPEPYTLNSTILGHDGWVKSDGTSSASAHAKVVQAPWDSQGGSNALRLWRETTDTTSIRLKHDLAEPFEGEVTVTVGMAFNFPNTSGRTLFGFVDGANGRSPIVFGFSNSVTGGLFYRGSHDWDEVIFLPRDQVRLNSVYTFTLSINVATETFDLSVSGLKADGTEYFFSQSNLKTDVFAKKKLTTLYVENGGNVNHMSYISFIDVKAIPEPGSVALLLGGGLVAFWVSRARRRRARLL